MSLKTKFQNALTVTWVTMPQDPHCLIASSINGLVLESPEIKNGQIQLLDMREIAPHCFCRSSDRSDPSQLYYLSKEGIKKNSETMVKYVREKCLSISVSDQEIRRATGKQDCLEYKQALLAILPPVNKGTQVEDDFFTLVGSVNHERRTSIEHHRHQETQRTPDDGRRNRNRESHGESRSQEGHSNQRYAGGHQINGPPRYHHHHHQSAQQEAPRGQGPQARRQGPPTDRRDQYRSGSTVNWAPQEQGRVDQDRRGRDRRAHQQQRRGGRSRFRSRLGRSRSRTGRSRSRSRPAPMGPRHRPQRDNAQRGEGQRDQRNDPHTPILPRGVTVITARAPSHPRSEAASTGTGPSTSTERGGVTYRS